MFALTRYIIDQRGNLNSNFYDPSKANASINFASTSKKLKGSSRASSIRSVSRKSKIGNKVSIVEAENEMLKQKLLE